MAVVYGRTKKWTKPTITFGFTNTVVDAPLFTQADAVSSFKNACKQWAACSGLEFVESTDPTIADIPITWMKLDGAGDVLAHVTGKPDGSNNQIPMAFDTSEEWTKNNFVLSAANFGAIALHELGHVIGLGHSADPNSVMYPVDAPFVPRATLTIDDEDGAKYLYKTLDTSGIVIVNETDVYSSWFAFNSDDGLKWIALASGNLAPGELRRYDPVKNLTDLYFVRFTQNGGGTELAGCIAAKENLLSLYTVGSNGFQVEVTK